MTKRDRILKVREATQEAVDHAAIALKVLDLAPNDELREELEALCASGELIIDMCDEREPPEDDREP